MQSTIPDTTTSYAPYPGAVAANLTVGAYTAIAVQHYDIIECMNIAAWAKACPGPDATQAAVLLLKRPANRRQRRRWLERRWIELRRIAIDALYGVNDPTATHALAGAVMFDVPEIRTLAHSALARLGAPAVPALVESMRAARDWPLEGMEETLDTLADVRQLSAGPALTRVLFGLLPETSERWLKRHLKLTGGLAVGFALLSALLFCIRLAGDVDSPPLMLFALLVMSAILSGVYFAVLLFPIALFVTAPLHRSEQNVLNRAAGAALAEIRDPRSVPSHLEVVAGHYPASAREGALLALQAALPRIGAEHCDLFNATSERNLTNLLISRDSRLVYFALGALEHVGSGQSAAPVARLLKRSSGNGSAAIRQEAERVLPILQERLRQAEANSVLLRASQQHWDGGGSLLRPAVATAEENAQQLVRPSYTELP